MVMSRRSSIPVTACPCTPVSAFGHRRLSDDSGNSATAAGTGGPCPTRKWGTAWAATGDCSEFAPGSLGRSCLGRLGALRRHSHATACQG